MVTGSARGTAQYFQGKSEFALSRLTAMIVLVTTIAKIIQKRLTVFLTERMNTTQELPSQKQ